MEHAGRRPSSKYRYLLYTVGVAVALLALVLFISYLAIAPYREYVLRVSGTQTTAEKRLSATIRDKDITAGIVLGSGITKDGKPFRELQSRLDTAAEALNDGYVDKLVLSGDNRFPGYNEPKAMLDYLVQKRGIDLAKLQPDYAGRSTYESCERASKVFQLKEAVIFSAGSHLPRAIYLCRSFGIDSYGIASPAEANNAMRREAVARVKALYNVHIDGERTILGQPIKL